MMFMTNYPLTARQYVDALTQHYYIRCDTKEEAKKLLRINHVAFVGSPLTELQQIPENCVLVEFAKEDNYTEHEYLCMSVPAKYYERFCKYLADEELN